MPPSDPPEITDAEIDAAWEVLSSEIDPPYMAHGRDFSDDQVYAGVLRAASDDADRRNRDLVRRALAAAWAARNQFSCPRCGRTSYHPTDAAEGYCGACHDWTSR